MSNDEREEQKGRRSGGFNIGWIIFLLLAFGGPLFRWLQSIWSSLSVGGGASLPFSSDFIPWIIGGTVATIVVISVLRAIAGTGGNSSPGPLAPPYSPLPTANQRPALPPSRPFPPGGRPGPQQPSAGLPQPRQLGGPPRFEPIIAPRVLLAGIIGLLVLGFGWLLFFAQDLLGRGIGGP